MSASRARHPRVPPLPRIAPLGAPSARVSPAPAPRPFRLPPILLVMLLLVGCGRMMGCTSYEYEWNQRVTAVVETPDGVRTGSGVINIVWQYGAGPGGAGNSYYADHGEYPLVDLGGGRYLALLFRSQGLGYTNYGADAVAAFSDKPFGARDVVRAPRDEPRPLTLRPLMVTFEDPSDPSSVRRVDPDDLAATFGPGYRLKALTIAITNDPPTEGAMVDAFPWLDDLDGKRLDGGAYGLETTSNLLANDLGRGSFTQQDFGPKSRLEEILS